MLAQINAAIGNRNSQFAFGACKRISDCAFGFRSLQPDTAACVHISAAASRIRNSHPEFVVCIGDSDLTCEIRSLDADYGADIRDSETTFKTRNLHPRFGCFGWISEVVSSFPNLHTGFGTFTRRSASVWPLEEFHDEVIHTVLPADIEYRTNMRMTQAGESLSFAFETSPHGTIRNVFGQHLNGHGPIQACITRFIDLSHPARANRLRDFGLCIRPSVITSRLYHAIIS